MPIVEEFLFGSAISEFQCSLAWGGSQGGHLTCTLVDDPSVGTSFTPPSVGTPVYFTYSNFPYAGIFRDYIRDLSTGGATYRVTLSDVSEIIGNAQVIINGYTGYATVNNLLNVFGYLESIEYGNSEVIEAGMPYNKLISGLNYVANNVTNYGSPITYMGNNYYLDLSELPSNISNYYINGDVINLLDLISQICADNSLDFFFRMRRSNGRNVVYVKTVSRTNNAQPGRIAAFVAANTVGATATTVGVELRNETTAKVVLGDNVLDMRQFQTTFPSGYLSTTAGMSVKNNKITFDANYPKYYAFNPKYRGFASNLTAGPFVASDGTRIGYPVCFPHATKIVEITDNEILPFFGTDIMGFQYTGIKAQEEADFISYMKRCFDGTLASGNPGAKPLRGYVDRLAKGTKDIKNTDIIPVGRSVISYLVWYHDNVFFQSNIPNYNYFITIGEIRAAIEGQDAWDNYVSSRSSMILNAALNRQTGWGAYRSITTDSAGKTLDISGLDDDIVNKHREIYMDQTASPYTSKKYGKYIYNDNATRAQTMQLSSLYPGDLSTKALVDQLGKPTVRGQKSSAAADAIKAGSRFDAVRARTGKIYDNIHNLAQECYGRKFVIRLRDVYVKLNDQLRPAYSDDPSNEGYTESSALGLNLFEQTFFKNEEGKLECFVEFDSVDFIDLTKLNIEDYFIKTTADKKSGLAKTYTNRTDIDTLFFEGQFGESARLYLRCTVEPYLLFGSYFISLVALGASSNEIDYDDVRIVVNLSSPVYFRENCQIDGARSISDEPLSQPKFYPNSGLEWYDRMARVRGRTPTQQEINDMNNTLTAVASKSLAQQLTPAVLIPRAACFATKSNVRRYGPWQAQGAAGKVEFENDSNLNPWTFNGYDNMSLVGNAKAQGAVSNMQYTETGSVSSPGAPAFELGDVIISGGPVITDIGVSVGSNGVVTSYNMRTFTPSFGELSRRYQEQIRQNTQKTVVTQKNEKITNRVFAGKVFTGNGNDTRKIDMKMGTPHELLVAQAVPTLRYTSTSGVVSGSGTYYDHEVSTETLFELRPELNQDYMQKAAMSLDGMFRPYVINPYADTFEALYGTGPSGFPTMVVNPLQSGSYSLSPFGPIGSGHDITYVTRGGEIPDDLDCKKGTYDELNHYRALGIKMPLVAVGWGYDTDGYPVPAAPSGHRFNPNGDRHEFAEDYLDNPATWKAGPVDLRWSESDAMWVPPGGSTTTTQGSIQILRGIAQELIPPFGSGHVLILSSTATTGLSGNPLVESWLGQPVCSGQKVLVGLDNGITAASGYLTSGSISPYYIVSSEYTNLQVPTNIRCVSGEQLIDLATIYLSSAYSLETDT